MGEEAGMNTATEPKLLVRIFCEDMVPPSPNVMRRKYRHFRAYGQLRDMWGRMIHALVGRQGNTLNAAAWAGAKVRVEICITHSRLFDQDNLYGSVKVILDSLKNCGFIRDDSQEHIDLLVTQRKAPDVGTEIRISA